tara:strand:+ start:13951 stop:14904 length:954 start_codon:yes stop_codon:yes gene_type:complete
MKPQIIKFLPTVVLCLFMTVISCSEKAKKKSVDENSNRIEDSIANIPEEIVEPELVINYKIDSLKTSVELDSFKNKYSDADQKIIYAINRIEEGRVRAGNAIVIPDTLLMDLLSYAPFPKKLELLNDIPKTVLISQRVQGFALYENGKLIKWGPISSGKQSTPTPNGLHYGNYKAREKVSTVDDEWLLPFYFNFMNFEGVGVHQYALPGYPASHACVRLYMEDATFIYDWAKQWELTSNGRYVHKNGTPFMVFGEYDYKADSPWIQLATNNMANELLEAELKTLQDYKTAYDADEKNVKDFGDKQKDDLLALNTKAK